MMRHFRVSAATQPQCTARTKMTGFNLFTQSMQKEKKVLKAKSLKGGYGNMRIMATLWGKLPAFRREMYNSQALQRAALMTGDPEKKHNKFNLLMRLFGSNKVLLKAGDESFTALMAKSTMHAMSSKDTRQLQEKLKVKTFSTSKERPHVNVASTFKRFVSPSMLLFNSFTEMQRSVTPTRKSAFTAVAQLRSFSNITISGEKLVMHRYSSLPPELRNLFAPISDIEAPFFELFCASRCAGFNRKRFEIIRLFASFRGIKVDLGSNAVQDQLFRSLVNTDRSRDGIYFRVHRSLERLEMLRSSDCGFFIAKRLLQSIKMNRAAYSLDSGLDDVSVATLLAETRSGQSVYDDVLTRAAILRTNEKNKQLSVYNVAQMMQTETLCNKQTRVERVKKVKVTPELSPSKPVLKLKAARAPLKKKLASKTKPQLAQTMPIVTKEVATKAKPEASPKRNAAPPMKRQLVTKRTASVSRAKTKRVPATRRVHVKVGAARKAVAAASKKALKKVATTPQATAATDEDDDLFAEDVMTENEGSDVDPGFVDKFAAATVAPVTQPTAPAKQRHKETKHRAVRSHLLAPESMLPAAARSQKVITAHTSTCRKAPRPVSTSHSLPFTPTRRKVSFADNIRAQLASFL
ncbi:hypothetical protein, conserved [Leishmania lindenbergi]|uniref:Kinetoplast DNA-associated protein n=1 Tax=Leishmania lindenbergi TaxID=651832 RepID=A0AAW3AM81_9TRYP